MLQPELKSIKDGLIYVEDKDCFFKGNEYKYRGYLNSQGQRQGAGILVEIEYYCKHIGEWHEDEPHGITNIEDCDGFSIWGQYRHGSREGYWTEKFSDGTVNYLMYKEDYRNGYGIQTNDDGEVY